MDPQLIFLLFCIPARYGLAHLASRVSETYAAALGTVFLAIGASFMYLFFSNSRLDAPEAGGEGTWWHHLRPIHGLLYLGAGGVLLAGYPKQYATTLLGADLLIGVAAHISKHW
jgi:hypothetical protein